MISKNKFQQLAKSAAKKYGLTESTLMAYVDETTDWNAVNLFGLSDELAANFSKSMTEKDVTDELSNVASELSSLNKKHNGDEVKALFDLNFGEGQFDIIKSSPDFNFDAEQSDFIKGVMAKNPKYGGEAPPADLVAQVNSTLPTANPAKSKELEVAAKPSTPSFDLEAPVGELKKDASGRYYTGNDYVDAVMALESSNGTDPKMNEGKYVGLFQFDVPTAKRFGLITKEGDFRKDPVKSLEAFKKATAYEAKLLREKNLPVTGINGYMLHQQGMTGGLRAIRAANSGSKENISGKKNISQNVTSDDAKSVATYNDFVNKTGKLLTSKLKDLRGTGNTEVVYDPETGDPVVNSDTNKPFDDTQYTYNGSEVASNVQSPDITSALPSGQPPQSVSPVNSVSTDPIGQIAQESSTNSLDVNLSDNESPTELASNMINTFNFQKKVIEPKKGNIDNILKKAFGNVETADYKYGVAAPNKVKSAITGVVKGIV